MDYGQDSSCAHAIGSDDENENDIKSKEILSFPV